MNRKELKTLAKKIAECERIISSNNSSKDEVSRAKDDVLYYTSKISSLEEVIMVDEMVQKFLDNF